MPSRLSCCTYTENSSRADLIRNEVGPFPSRSQTPGMRPLQAGRYRYRTRCDGAPARAPLGARLRADVVGAGELDQLRDPAGPSKRSRRRPTARACQRRLQKGEGVVVCSCSTACFRLAAERNDLATRGEASWTGVLGDSRRHRSWHHRRCSRPRCHSASTTKRLEQNSGRGGSCSGHSGG